MSDHDDDSLTCGVCKQTNPKEDWDESHEEGDDEGFYLCPECGSPYI